MFDQSLLFFYLKYKIWLTKASNMTPIGNPGEVSFTLEVSVKYYVTSNQNDLAPASYGCTLVKLISSPINRVQ